MKTPRGVTSSGPLADTINRIRDELVRLRIQSSPDFKSTESPSGTFIVPSESETQQCFLARHFVETEEGEDALGQPILIGKFTLEVSHSLFPATNKSPYDKRSKIWQLSKLFAGTVPSELLTINDELPEDNLTFNSSDTPAVTREGFWGPTLAFVLTRIGINMETNPWEDFTSSTFSMWKYIPEEPQRVKLWDPLYHPPRESMATPEQTYIKVPYWLIPFGFTAPFIPTPLEPPPADPDAPPQNPQILMGHMLTEDRHDVVANFKVVVYANEYVFNNAVTGALDENCLPVDNSTPVRKFGAFYAPFQTTTGQQIFALLRNDGTNGATDHIAMRGPFTEYTGQPERWLVPTSLVTSWQESEQRISVSDVIAAGGVLETTVQLPVFRCIRRGDTYEVSGFFFDPYNQPYGERSFNPATAVAMQDYIDFNPSGGTIASANLGSTTELVVRAHVYAQNCSYDPAEPPSFTNRPFLPYYEAGFFIKQRDAQPGLWKHNLTYGTVEQTCNDTQYTLETISAETDDTWLQEAKPLDVYKPPQTLFFFPRGEYQKAYSQAGYYTVSEVDRPQPDPC